MNNQITQKTGASTMGSFAKAGELREYVGGIFETAFQDPELGATLRDTGVVLKIVTTDPDDQLVIDLGGAEVGSGANANVVMRTSSRIANDFWLGKVDMLPAIAKKEVFIDGSPSLLLKLLPAGSSLFPAYRARLERDGRTDLLSD